jgi:hypothetical protein
MQPSHFVKTNSPKLMEVCQFCKSEPNLIELLRQFCKNEPNQKIP